ncbi:MAG: glycosyltransferase family 2 protein, partial [Desulfobacteraceae bacterium]
MRSQMKSPISRVTIIVCSCNRERLLAETINSITGLRKPRQAHIEVIVVDNASTDNTPLIINNLASPFPIQYVREERLGHSIALNRGVRESKGELLLFTDDDALVDVDWLFEYWRYANAHREAGYFFSKII